MGAKREMSETPEKRAKSDAPIQLQQESVSVNRIKRDKICVIITQKKNISWVEDLDARERLSRCQRVFH